MFTPKKEGRLSRRAARFTLLLWKPAIWCMLFTLFVALFEPFVPRLIPLAKFTTPVTMLGMALSYIPLINHLRCPHCDEPQLRFRGSGLERPGFWEEFEHKFVAQWSSPDGGYCIWCDCLMKYDDVE